MAQNDCEVRSPMDLKLWQAEKDSRIVTRKRDSAPTNIVARRVQRKQQLDRQGLLSRRQMHHLLVITEHRYKIRPRKR